MLPAIIPVKALDQAKGRLAPILTPAERRRLVLAMLDDVLAVLRASQHVDRAGVISRDAAVIDLARMRGAEALYDRAADLNGALTQAAAYYADKGAAGVLVLPADIPLIRTAEIEALIATNGAGPGITLAPSRDGGTNALLMRPPLALPLLFGADSLARHCAAARARALPVRIVRTPGLELDVDRPADLPLLMEMEGATATQRLLRDLGVVVQQT